MKMQITLYNDENIAFVPLTEKSTGNIKDNNVSGE
jgi:hypothetical protein